MVVRQPPSVPLTAPPTTRSLIVTRTLALLAAVPCRRKVSPGRISAGILSRSTTGGATVGSGVLVLVGAGVLVDVGGAVGTRVFVGGAVGTRVFVGGAVGARGFVAVGIGVLVAGAGVVGSAAACPITKNERVILWTCPVADSTWQSTVCTPGVVTVISRA